MARTLRCRTSPLLQVVEDELQFVCQCRVPVHPLRCRLRPDRSLFKCVKHWLQREREDLGLVCGFLFGKATSDCAAHYPYTCYIICAYCRHIKTLRDEYSVQESTCCFLYPFSAHTSVLHMRLFKDTFSYNIKMPKHIKTTLIQKSISGTGKWNDKPQRRALTH